MNIRISPPLRLLQGVWVYPAAIAGYAVVGVYIGKISSPISLLPLAAIAVFVGARVRPRLALAVGLSAMALPYTWGPEIPKLGFGIGVLVGLIFLVANVPALKGFRPEPLDLAVLAFAVTPAAITAFQGNPFHITYWIAPTITLPYFGFRLFFRSTDARRVFPPAIISIGTVAALIGIWEGLTGHNPIVTAIAPTYSTHGVVTTWDVSLYRGGHLRALSTFGHPIAFGMFLLIPLAFALARRGPWSLIAAGIILTAEALTYSRGPWVAALVVLVLLVGRRSGRILAIAAALLAVAIFVGPIHRVLIESTSAPTEAGHNTNYRLGLLDAAFHQTSLLGHPFADLQTAIPNYPDVTSLLAGTIIRTGVVGLAEFVVIACLAIRALLRARRSADRDYLAAASALTAQLVGLLSVTLITNYQSFFWALVAYVATAPIPPTSRVVIESNIAQSAKIEPRPSREQRWELPDILDQVPGHLDDIGQWVGGPLPPKHTVALIPGSARIAYRELFRALEEAYPVRFVGSSGSDIGSADGVIVTPGGRRPERLTIPCLVLEGPRAEEQRGFSFAVEMSRCAGLDRALHGQRLMEHNRKAPGPVAIENGSRVLAVAAGKPIWARSDAGGTDCETASALPSELEDREFLRDHLTAGRFWSLLPIVHFLKRISCDAAETAQVRRACFVIDDPNPRFSSYGHVRFHDLARDARECNYHVAVATIPLDLLLPGRGAVSVFQESPSELSLVVHGNDHVHRELERRRGAVEAEMVILSAAARVARFEKRAGIRIERVMCPPHGGCSPETLAALFRCGFLGLAASRPFPWEGFDDHRRWRLGGWLPAQLAGGGCPVVPRYPLSRDLDDLVFRALLGQPLVLYCHQADLRDGLEPFRVAAARVAELGDVEWMSLASIMRGNARCREKDGVATVTVYSRDVRIRRPAAPTVRVEVPRVFEVGDLVRLVVDGTTHEVQPRTDGAASITLANVPKGDEFRIQLSARGNLAAAPIRNLRPRAWPLARRAMTEMRDRALPLVRDLHR